jgi:hypothetical protein
MGTVYSILVRSLIYPTFLELKRCAHSLAPIFICNIVIVPFCNAVKLNTWDYGANVGYLVAMIVVYRVLGA